MDAISKLEPLDKLLVFLIVFFTVLLVLISKWSPNDGQTFQVIGGGLTGSLGAFLARIQPGKKADSKPPEGQQ